MKLEVSPYLLVDTLTDWLAIQITFNEGVQVYRSRTRDKAEAHYNSLKAQGKYHMLALMSGEGECALSEYKPFVIPQGLSGAMVETKLPVTIVDAPSFKLPEPTVSQDGRLPYGHPDTPEGKAHGIAPVGDWNTAIQKMVDHQKQNAPPLPPGFGTGLPSGFKTGK